MTNRIVVDPTQFKVSYPGIDVLPAVGASLMFDGNMASPARFITGSVAGSRSGSGTTNHTAGLGKVFSVPPFVMVNVVAGSGATAPGVVYSIKGFGDSKTVWRDFAFSWSIFGVKVGTSTVDFSMTSYGSTFSYTIQYLVFDYRLGF